LSGFFLAVQCDFAKLVHKYLLLCALALLNAIAALRVELIARDTRLLRVRVLFPFDRIAYLDHPFRRVIAKLKFFLHSCSTYNPLICLLFKESLQVVSVPEKDT
jgi:hypothetical protein